MYTCVSRCLTRKITTFSGEQAVATFREDWLGSRGLACFGIGRIVLARVAAKLPGLVVELDLVVEATALFPEGDFAVGVAAAAATAT